MNFLTTCLTESYLVQSMTSMKNFIIYNNVLNVNTKYDGGNKEYSGQIKIRK